MSSRPTDWHVLDLDRDPVPGDPYEVKELARKLASFADDVSTALRSVRGLGGDSAVQEWAGLSGDEYRSQFGDLPGELEKLERSYRMAGGALEAYWPKLETAQADADRALSQGRTARHDLDAAKSSLDTANDWVRRANDKSKEYQKDPKPGVPPPSEDEVRAATRNATSASQAQTSANSAVHDAQGRLDAAKELAAQAAGLRDSAAETCAHALGEASHAGIRNKHWWEKAVDWVADHWDDIVAACKVIVAVLGIVVLIIGGPLAWLVLAAAVVVLADTVAKYLQGKASLWDVMFAALDCIPMFKGLTTAGGLLKMAKEFPALLKSGKALENLANGIRKGVGGIRQMGREIKNLFTCGDPIDMATGEMVMSATDVELPGILPLVVERHHRSSYRGGRWFGKSWASTLDQRLWVDDEGVRYTSEDGMILYYPVPAPETPVMPVEGPRWPLTWSGEPGGSMVLTRPETGRTLRFKALPDGNPAQLPLTELTDRNSNRIEVQYNDDGTPRELVHNGGYRVGIESTDGRVTALRLLSAPDQPILRSYGYDAARNLNKVVNSSGLPLTFTYDNRNRITCWEDRNGTWYRYEYDENDRCVNTTGSDGVLNYTYVYDEDTRTTVATNSLGHPTTYTFNAHYQLVGETDPLGHTTLRTWDRYDRLLTSTDPLGRTTHCTYDLDGNLIRVARADGTVVTAEYNDLGLPVRLVTADGSEWIHAYDDRGNLIASVDPLGAETTLERDAQGRLISTSDAVGNTHFFAVNAAGLPITATDPVGATTHYERDALGRLTELTGPLGDVTHFAWTIEGRLTERILPDGATERWCYDGEGNLIEHRDALDAVTLVRPTHFELPAARISPDGSRLEFTYDTELRLTRVMNGAGHIWEYEYNPAGRLIREVDFNDRALTYEYDAAGQLTKRVNGAGQSLCYDRDDLGRITEIRDGDGATTVFGYDRAGSLVRAVNADADLLMERDPLGRVMSETVNGNKLTSTFDILGRRLERRTPTGSASTWEYNSSHQTASLTVDGNDVVFSYDAVGREYERRFNDAFSLVHAWDSTDRLIGQRATGAVSSSLGERSFAYRLDGRLTRAADQATGSRSFDFDPIGRITAVHAPGWTETYAYDSAGNMAHAATPSSTAEGSQGERHCTGTLLHRAGRTTYEYDGQCRVIRHTRRLLSGGRRTWTYEWDAQDRMTSVVTPDGTKWRYRYDPLSRRIAKQRMSPDGTVAEDIRFTWDGTRLAEQSIGDLTTTWEYVPGTHRPLTQTDRRARGDQDQAAYDSRFYAIVTDVVGTPTELIDSTGKCAWQAKSTVWGSPLNASNGSPAECALRFPGQFSDPETGLNYNHLRYYDPETARYQSPDPLGLVPAPNHHVYVENPYDEIDPLGLSPCTEALNKLKPGEIFLYRAVMQKELDQLLQTRRFWNPPGIETKYFSMSAEGAAAYARQMFQRFPQEGPYTLVRAVIRQDAINPESLIEHLADAGGGIDAIAVSLEEMAHIGRVRILPFMPIP